MTEGKGGGDGSPPASEEGEKAWRDAHWQPTVDDFVRKAELTGNHLYLWLALYYHFNYQPTAQMPKECRNYLCQVASNIYSLAHETDPRHPISRKPGEHVARALLLKKPGWNAFKNYAGDRMNERIAVAHDVARHSGFRSPFLERLRQSIEDERTIRRQKSKGAELLGWTKRTKPNP